MNSTASIFQGVSYDAADRNLHALMDSKSQSLHPRARSGLQDTKLLPWHQILACDVCEQVIELTLLGPLVPEVGLEKIDRLHAVPETCPKRCFSAGMRGKLLSNTLNYAEG